MALKLVLAVGCLIGALIALHFVAALTWQALPWTRQHPLPPFLTSPVPELLLANALVLPLAMACMVLMAAVDPQKQVVGAMGMLGLACYLGLVAAVLLALARRQQQLGLTYTRLDKSPETGIKLARPSRWLGASRGSGQGATIATASPFQNVPSKEGQGQLGYSARVLLRFSPPQAHGYWSQADVVVQQQLRHTYQGWSCCRRLGACGNLARCLQAEPAITTQLMQATGPRCGRCQWSCGRSLQSSASRCGGFIVAAFSSLPVGVLVIATQGMLAVLPSDAFLHPIVQVDDPIGSYQRQQALLQEVQDRFGCLFMDFKGTSKIYFLAALLRLLVPALKGLLLGWFVSECASLPQCCWWPEGTRRICLTWGWGRCAAARPGP